MHRRRRCLQCRGRDGGGTFEVIYFTRRLRRLSLSLARKESCGNLAVSVADGPDPIAVNWLAFVVMKLAKAAAREDQRIGLNTLRYDLLGQTGRFRPLPSHRL